MKTYIITDSLGEKHRIQAPTIEKAVDKYNRTLVRDALSSSDKEIIDDAINALKRRKEKVTAQKVIKELEEDMSGFVGKNKQDIINYVDKFKDSLTKDATMGEAWFDRIKASDLKEIKDFDLILVKKDSGSALLKGKKEDLLEFADYIGIDIDIL